MDDLNNSVCSNLGSSNNTIPDNINHCILLVVEWIVICTGLPLTLVAVGIIFSVVRKDQVAPLYVINLLISDLIQLSSMTATLAVGQHFLVFYFYIFGVMASVGFMACISLERYLIISWPLWYRFKRNLKTSVVVSAVVWILPLVYILPVYFKVNDDLTKTIYAVYFLLPFPLFIFCLFGTIKALSGAHNVPPDEKQRIVIVLVVVLLIYTLLFLPSIIWFLVENTRTHHIFRNITSISIFLSPHADFVMYIFIRKGAANEFLTCCC